MRTIVLLGLVIVLLFGCKKDDNSMLSTKAESTKEEMETIQRKDTVGLIVLHPLYSKIDLVCGTIPQKNDSSVILFAESAYTEKLLIS